MRKFITLFISALLSLAALAGTPIKKSDLRVLYVGGTSDKDRGGCASDEEYQASVRERMAAFEAFLKEYFNNVTVVNAADYTQAMSDAYDVTVMDGRPQSIVPQYMDMARQMYLKPAYLTEDFDRPMLTIGQASSDIGSRVGSKNDWYCLCLAGDAFDWKEGHPIFQGPFKVKMTVTNKPTPEEGFHYAYAYDGEIPETLPMWQVQTKSFKDDAHFPVGLVSRYDGYEDSPEAEVISGGVSSKALNAVAIARHGNFFHWGFAASPAYLTEEAKPVLANAIVYIAQFDGQGIIARKYNETIATRASIKEFVYTASEEGYQEMVEMNDAANTMLEERKKNIQAKQAKGETLTEEDRMYLNFTPMPMKSREEMLQLIMPEYFAMFGTDGDAYARYFDENRDYLYGGESRYSLVLDEDAKSLGIPNNDIRLIDEAIKMLEAGKDVAKGKRILARYTLADFVTPAEWRAWFDKNRSNMFFTEAGGWVWLINSREPGVNDYKGWELRRRESALKVPETTDLQPVAVAASREVLQDGSQVVLLKMKMHPGYHIYSAVGSGEAFIPLKVEIALPEGYEKQGDMQRPAPLPFNTNGTMMYEDTVVFVQPVTGTGAGTLTCTVSYQCCNNNICYPPAEQTVTVQLN